jgi:hypothetical protein
MKTVTLFSYYLLHRPYSHPLTFNLPPHLLLFSYSLFLFTFSPCCPPSLPYFPRHFRKALEGKRSSVSISALLLRKLIYWHSVGSFRTLWQNLYCCGLGDITGTTRKGSLFRRNFRRLIAHSEHFYLCFYLPFLCWSGKQKWKLQCLLLEMCVLRGG